MYCWWECQLVQPFWKTVWRCLRKLKVEPPCEPATPLPGIHLKKTKPVAQRYVHFLVHCSIQTPSFEKTVFFPLCILDTLVEDHLTIHGWVYFKAPYSVPLVCMRVLYCFDYCSFVICFKIRKCDAFSVALFAQDCFSYL